MAARRPSMLAGGTCLAATARVPLSFIGDSQNVRMVSCLRVIALFGSLTFYIGSMAGRTANICMRMFFHDVATEPTRC